MGTSAVEVTEWSNGTKEYAPRVDRGGEIVVTAGEHRGKTCIIVGWRRPTIIEARLKVGTKVFDVPIEHAELVE